MDDYNKIWEKLTPKHDIKASRELRKRVHATLKQRGQDRLRKTFIWGIGSASIAAAILCAILLPTGMSAKKLLASAIDALTSRQTVEMDVDVRTLPMETFSFIDIDKPFVRHHITVSKNDSTIQWRVDKGGRAAYGTLTENYTWIPSFDIGWHSHRPPEAILDYISTFLSPEKIIEAELYQSIGDNGSTYQLARNGQDINLTIHAKPLGDFSNPYMLNRSIAESENIRKYTFDADTRLLKSASVTVIDKGNLIEVLRIKDIRYNADTQTIANLPQSIKFIDYDKEFSELGFTALPPEEVAAIVLNAFAEWDEEIIHKAIPQEIGDKFYKGQYKGSQLVSVGKPFRSGKSGNVFVPCSVKMPDGHITKPNVVLSQQPDSTWIISGGL